MKNSTLKIAAILIVLTATFSSCRKDDTLVVTKKPTQETPIKK